MMETHLYLSLLLVLLPCLEKSQASKTQLQTFDMSHHLSSASNCNRVSTAGLKNRQSTAVLEVVYKNSPCAQTDKNRPVNLPSAAKIFANDQLRVKSIQNRVIKPVDSINTNKDPNKSNRVKRTQLPTRSGMPLDTLNYIVTIGLGTPERRLSLMFDTGSDLMWTQCKPCLRQCYPQNDTIFDPSTSITYSNISCNSKLCSQYNNGFGCYNDIICAYARKYGDGSYTVGFLSKDKLTLTPTDVIQGFLFGCGQDNTGNFGRTDGLLGLSTEPLSFVSQTTEIYHKKFSYCLPSNIYTSGFLSFGENNKATKKEDDAMIFTDLVPPPPGVQNIYYFITITAISVGGEQLVIDKSVFATIIDSGTVITRLPQAAYNTMSKEFKNQMNKLNYRDAQPYSILDTCFHMPPNITRVKVPSVSFTFVRNATLDLDVFGILYVPKPKYACLAFAGNNDPSYLAIFGNTQQKNFEVMYDVTGKKLGFARNPNCRL